MPGIKEILQKQETYFRSGKTEDVSFRIDRLKRLKEALGVNEKAIYEALEKDFKKPAFETYVSEIGIVLNEISFTIKHLPSWTKPEKVKTPITNFPSRSYIYSEPYGVVLIIGAWNYPLQLTLNPLVGALAAGNCAVLKPSEISSHTSNIIAKIIGGNFEEEYITVVEGGVEINKALLNENFDYIFFTGSVQVGKIVMEAASKHLTPVTLELGGKSPAIVDEEADVDLAAKRIVSGKFLNAGQTCVAPDYVMVHKRIKNDLLNHLDKYIHKFYGKDPSQSPDFPRIINERHFERLSGYLDNGTIITGGQTKEEEKYIAPTIIDNITWDDPLMREEIFGPLLPVVEFENLAEVIETVNQHPKPLSLYFFSENKKKQEMIIKEIRFGGGCINDTVAHFINHYLPFGGIGDSGLGSYHGKASFDTFSHKKSMLKKSTWLDIPLRYPPYGGKLKWIKKIFEWS